jgi:hypothetical protein
VESILGPLSTSVTEWPIVPAQGDCEDGEFGEIKIGRGNRGTHRKPAPAPLCPPQISLVRPGSNPGRSGGKPATHPLNYGAAFIVSMYTEGCFENYIKQPIKSMGAEPSLGSPQLHNYWRISQNYMEPEGSLSCSQDPTTSSYPEPHESSPYHPNLFSNTKH